MQAQQQAAQQQQAREAGIRDMARIALSQQRGAVTADLAQQTLKLRRDLVSSQAERDRATAALRERQLGEETRQFDLTQAARGAVEERRAGEFGTEIGLRERAQTEAERATGVREEVQKEALGLEREKFGAAQKGLGFTETLAIEEFQLDRAKFLDDRSFRRATFKEQQKRLREAPAFRQQEEANRLKRLYDEAMLVRRIDAPDFTLPKDGVPDPALTAALEVAGRPVYLAGDPKFIAFANAEKLSKDTTTQIQTAFKKYGDFAALDPEQLFPAPTVGQALGSVARKAARVVTFSPLGAGFKALLDIFGEDADVRRALEKASAIDDEDARKEAISKILAEELGSTR